MIPLARWPAISITIGVLAVAAAVFAFCRPSPTAIPRAEQTTVDSLDATKPAFRATRDTLVQRETVFVHQSAINRAQAIKSTRAADSLRDVAIRWQDAALAQSDTSSRWYRVAIVRAQESDSLRSALGGAMSALEEQTKARTAADARDVLDSTRLAAVEDLNDRLAADLKHADPPCRIALVLRCPSRTATVLASIPLGVLAKVTYDRIRKRKS